MAKIEVSAIMERTENYLALAITPDAERLFFYHSRDGWLPLELSQLTPLQYWTYRFTEEDAQGNRVRRVRRGILFIEVKK